MHSRWRSTWRPLTLRAAAALAPQVPDSAFENCSCGGRAPVGLEGKKCLSLLADLPLELQCHHDCSCEADRCVNAP